MGAIRDSEEIIVRQREAEVLRLRKAGFTFAAIAEALQFYDASGAKKAYDRAMQATIQQPADELRVLQRERLDDLLAGIWEKATKGDTWSVDRVLAIMDRQARLDGLDAPSRVNHTVTDAMMQEIEDLAATLGIGTEVDAP